MNRDELLMQAKANFDRALKIMEAKNSDYSKEHNGFENFVRVGYISGQSVERVFLNHLATKMVRLENLVSKMERGESAAVKDESIEDTLLDNINYLNIMLSWFQSKKKRVDL
jgi:hypothetical protein